MTQTPRIYEEQEINEKVKKAGKMRPYGLEHNIRCSGAKMNVSSSIDTSKKMQLDQSKKQVTFKNDPPLQCPPLLR